MAEWIDVRERLPEKSKYWETYIVVLWRSHWPTSTYDTVDAPYSDEFVMTAQYDSEQKIWYILRNAQAECLNALIDPEDSPLNGDCVAYWMPLPKPPEKLRNTEDCKMELDF